MVQLEEKNKIAKGNIPIDSRLLNKYDKVQKIFENEKNCVKVKFTVTSKIKELENINILNLKIGDLKKLAYKIFSNYHTFNDFKNDSNIINVSRLGVNESIEKIYHNRFQRDLLWEHLIVFSVLGKIIENAKLVNQVYERKGRM